MKKTGILKKSCLFLAGALTLSGALWADPLPFDFTFYGLYGAPTEPDTLAASNYDGLGFGGLLEWNPSYYASLGLSYEQTSFYGNQAFTAGTLNAEGRFFLASFVNDHSPYISAGAGFNLLPASGYWKGGSFGLKIGLGDKIPIAGPVLLDLGFDYHWMSATKADFQYADARVGLGYAFDITGGPEPSPTPVGTSSPAPTPAATSTPTSTSTPRAVEATPTQTPTEDLTPESTTVVSATETPTPEMEIEAEPTPSATETSPAVSKMKKYYRLGVKAFEARRYTAAIADLDLCLTFNDPNIPSFYYAEANATLGVIYQFHKKTPGHLKTAKRYYKKALKIDPDTKAAKKYLPMLSVSPTPTPAADDSAPASNS